MSINATTPDELVSFLPEPVFRETVQRRFEQLKKELQLLVPGSDIQHVGSTAISGSLTKGDLDIQVRVAASQYEAAKQRLQEIYNVNAGGFATNDAISFDDHTIEPHTGVHLTIAGGSGDIQWRFRDLLIASAALRRDCDDLKQQFEGKSMAKYRDAKAEFICKVLMQDSTAKFLDPESETTP